jgi:N-terminal acetyltransferase B complex non-catalytic subunit
LFATCQEYFDCNRTKLYCFTDLVGYLQALDKADLAKFVEHALKSQTNGNEQGLADSVNKLTINDPFKGVPMINALKIEYCFRLSSDESNVTRQRVEDFVARCLQLYQVTERPERDSESSTIESQPSDDLCILAAMCLIRFNGAEQNIRDITLIRAASILEHLIVDSPHNYMALLLLVRIYLLLGAGSLALKTFSKLSVKQIQFETVAHNLFTRLATIHPHSAPPVEGAEHKDFDPRSAFVQALNFYRSADITSARHRGNGLEYGSYANVDGTIDLQKRLRDSICRKLWALEVRRMQRLVGGDSMNRFDELGKVHVPSHVELLLICGLL